MTLSSLPQSVSSFVEALRSEQREDSREELARNTRPEGFEATLFTPASPTIAIAHALGLVGFIVAIIARN